MSWALDGVKEWWLILIGVIIALNFIENTHFKRELEPMNPF